MIYLLLAINALLMIVMPILLGIWLAYRYKVTWKLFLIGVVGYFVSQLGHLPFNEVVINPLIHGVLSVGETTLTILIASFLFGLSAAVFEEVTRYLFYNAMKTRRQWKEGMMFGAGWGGLEAIGLGILAAVQIVGVYSYQSGLIENFVSADNAETIAAGAQNVEKLLNSPLWAHLQGAVGRVIALILQMSLSILVLQVFVRKRKIWLFVAVGWHTLVDAAAAAAMIQNWDPLLIEMVIGIPAAIFGLYAILYFKPLDDPRTRRKQRAVSRGRR